MVFSNLGWFWDAPIQGSLVFCFKHANAHPGIAGAKPLFRHKKLNPGFKNHLSMPGMENLHSLHIYILFHVLVVSQQLDHRNSSIGLSSFSHYIHHYTSLYISMQRFHVFFPPDGPTTGASASTEPGQSCWQFEMAQRLTQLKAAVHMATVSRRCPSCSHWARCAIYGHGFFWRCWWVAVGLEGQTEISIDWYFCRMGLHNL